MESDQFVLFSLFGLPVTAYALCVTAAVAAGLALFFCIAKKRRIDTDAVWRTALLALPLGLLGARLFYCVARVGLYMEIGLDAVLRLWEGGYGLWGAVGGVALAAVIAGRSKGVRPDALLDALAAPGALTIALCRFGEYFSGEGRGPYVESEFFQRFPFAVFDGYYEEWNWAVFILEGIVALVILFVLMKKQRPSGHAWRLFLLLYSACQITLEAMRWDSYLRWLFVRVSQLTAAIVIVVMMLFACVRWLCRRENRRMTGKALLLRWAAVACCIGLIIALEFAADGKIWQDLPLWANYALMACACAVIGRCAYQVVFHSVFPPFKRA